MNNIDWVDPIGGEDAYEKYLNVEPLKSISKVKPKQELIPESNTYKLSENCIRFVVISDTHFNCLTELKLPPGDVLIHCGDMARNGTIDELKKVNEEFEELLTLYKKIVVIPGNHDNALFDCDPSIVEQRNFGRNLFTNATYLLDERLTVFGVTCYGSPWIPELEFGRHSFSVSRGEQIDQYWRMIPEDIDILITHAPPLGIRDLRKCGKHNGDLALLNHCWNRIRPSYHVFGHQHAGHGVFYSPELSSTVFVNAALCYTENEIRFRPMIFDYKPRVSILNNLSM